MEWKNDVMSHRLTFNIGQWSLKWNVIFGKNKQTEAKVSQRPIIRTWNLFWKYWPIRLWLDSVGWWGQYQILSAEPKPAKTIPNEHNTQETEWKTKHHRNPSNYADLIWMENRAAHSLAHSLTHTHRFQFT